MKFVTWNVNGIRACIGNGLKDYLITADADIVALQETKVRAMLEEPFLHGYEAVWCGAERAGYSGTVCLYKKEPLSIMQGLGDKQLDGEGRLITLEHPAFFFVNAYVPKSQDSLDRWNYRLNWDAAFIKYLSALQKRKPVIVCGDFNVARDYIDIYPENLRNIEKPHGFLTEEREGFNALLETGLRDVYRELYPDKEGAYTWWSNRLKKRLSNRGWRLDYFLVSDGLFPYVKSCVIKTEVMGSDHAPVEMVIDLDKATDDALEQLWRGIDWKKAEETLKTLQRDIAHSAFKRRSKVLADKQRRLLRSFEAKTLAVRHVCNSMSQPGIDGEKWDTDTDKMKAALSLDSRGYKAQPMRLLIITPRGQAKERHVQIPTHFDKAMQTLHAYSLDPVAESIGEKKSFAFRKGRSTQDIHAFILKAFDMYDPPRYVITCDVKACYASISHEWLLRNVPMDTHVLREFLKAGHVFRGELFPSNDFGISLGSSISPILGNLTLDGAQKAVYEGLHGGEYDIDFADGNLIRFADDIFVTARTKESAERIEQLLRKFLSIRGLTLSVHKTKIYDLSSEGFVFLSRHYQYSDGFVYATPSEDAVKKMENNVRDTIVDYRGSQKALIEKLNKKLIGWASYHRVTEAGQAFRHIDGVVKASLLELCEKRNPHMPREKIIAKYFYLEPGGEYVYALKNKPDVRIHRIANTPLINHHPVSVKKNPYIDDAYYQERTDERAIMNITGKYRSIWTRQRGKCYYCGSPILRDTPKTVVQTNHAYRAKDKKKALAYVHAYCREGQAEFYESDGSIDTFFDLYELLMRMKGRVAVPSGKKSKFMPLTEHFRQRGEAIFTLTFNEISKIIGQPLCGTALKAKQYWHRRGEKLISHSWTSNGYSIKNINFERKHVVFERDSDFGSMVDIPDVFTSGRIPHDAKAEVENMFEYIRRKYDI